MHADADLPAAVAAASALLRADLVAAGYSVERVTAAVGVVAAEALERGDRVAAQRALEPGAGGPLATVIPLFALGESVAVRDADDAFRAVGTAGVAGLGLARIDGEWLVPSASIRPWTVVGDGGVTTGWLASDRTAQAGELPDEHVLGIGAASRTLAGIAVSADGATLLDLGTGSGIQAVQATRSAVAVIGTDVSDRALEYARLNATLNDVHIELRHGSLYEPVEGLRFDRILCNPPFVITPRGRDDVPRLTHRDGGLVGDAIVEHVVRGALAHLTAGGLAQVLVNWEVRGDPEAARARVLDWAGADADAWLVERDRVDPAQYAEVWVRDAGVGIGSARGEELLRAWLDDLDARRVTEIGIGYITVRNPQDGVATWRRAEVQSDPQGAGVGVAIARAFAAHDWQRRRSDDAIAHSVLVVAPDVTEHRHHWPGAADPTVLELQQGSGFARRRHVDTVTAALVGACDGELSVGVISGAVSRLLDLDEAETMARLVPTVRELLVEGFLRIP